jgi:16S rRNA (cytidine1402-2'-O)-methyltransferase
MGTLYVVATPIGNLEDITLRALRVLKEADAIAAEDTRVTMRLLARYDIRKRLISIHEHSEQGKISEVIGLLKAGESIATVTDAGTPGLSDPGAALVRAAREQGLPVVAVPGPSALAAALSLSGISGDAFHFEGFLPSRPSKRRRRLKELRSTDVPVVFYEGPHRVVELMVDLRSLWGNLRAVVARELTKVHEEVVEGSLSDLTARFLSSPPRGEFTIILEAPGLRPTGDDTASE